MFFTIMSGAEYRSEPSFYAICTAFGSAYYLFEGELQQVSLDGDMPEWEIHDTQPAYFGGGEVDFDSGFDSEDAKLSVLRIREALRGVASVEVPA